MDKNLYKQAATFTLKASVSLLHNNLDILHQTIQGIDVVQFAAIHKSMVWILDSSRLKEGEGAHKRVVCKGEGVHSNSTIMQVKWCVLPLRTLLVITSLKGTQMFEADGTMMVFCQALVPKHQGQAQYARGISAVGDRHICIGSADGSIFVFDVPAKGTSVTLQEMLTEHKSSISDIHSYDGNMISSDETGMIVLWKAGGYFVKLNVIAGFGFPCSSIRLWKSLIIGGYGSGHIRVFNAETGNITTEISAHAKWINAIDVAEECGLLLSASEDTNVRVWDLNKMRLIFQYSVENLQLAGARFIEPSGDSFALTGYDCHDILTFKRTHVE